LISSIVTTLLIPEAALKDGGEANGRALAYIAHHYLGNIYGTSYDFSTIFILWFSGASSLAGLLSLVPRYLPRFGMAPDWARATRPLVLFFATTAFVVTYLFKANVDAQGGAYATGVLVLMTSAAIAVLLSLPREDLKTRIIYIGISLIFGYTTVMNIIQRPEGLHVAGFFILAIFVISIISRLVRTTELRTRNVNFDAVADQIIEKFEGKTMLLVAHAPKCDDYEEAAQKARQQYNLEEKDFVFLEIIVTDASNFSEDALKIVGIQQDKVNIFRCQSYAAPNAIASVLIALRNRSGRVPHAYMYWTEDNPVRASLKYLFLGVGETAPMTREILREAEKNISRRPKLHVV
jgi:hypothetical protein